MAASRVAKPFHLEQSYLVETSRKYVYYVAVMGRPLREIVIKLEKDVSYEFRGEFTGMPGKAVLTLSAFL